MFKIKLAFSTLTLVTIGIFLAVHLSKIREEDYHLYHSLLESSNPSLKGEEEISHTQQRRENVCKDIWFQDKSPLYFCITSATSELSLVNQNNKIEVMEELENVRCIMQEELFFKLSDGREVILMDEGKLFVKNGDPNNPEDWITPNRNDLIPMQLIRYLEAERAHYNYNTQLFVAGEVKLWKYCLEGHTPPLSFKCLTPLMEGRAQNLEFNLKGKEFDFQANRFRATFEAKEGSL